MIGKIMKNDAAKAEPAVGRLNTMGAAALVENPLLLRSGKCLLLLVAGALLSGAVIFDSCAPFSAGVVAVSGGGLGGLSALIGVVLGSFLRGGVDAAIKYSAAAVLVLAAVMVFKGTKWSECRWFIPLLTSAMTACTGLVYVSHDGWMLIDIVLYITEIVLAGGSTYFYTIVLSGVSGRESERRKLISLAAVACVFLVALSELKILETISVGRVLAVVLVLIAACKCTASVSAATGLAVGTALDAAAGSLPFFGPAMGMAGAAAGLFSDKRLVCAVAYIIANTGAMLCFGGGPLALASLYETFIASVAFVLLPEKWLLDFKESVSGKRGSYLGEETAKAYARKKAILAAEAFSAAYDSLAALGADKHTRQTNIATVFEAAAERKCASCDERDRCYGSEYETTRTAQNDASVRMVLRGEFVPEDLPEYFRERCRDIAGLSKVVNEEYKSYLRRRERLNQADEGYELLCGRFMDMSDVFAAFSEQLMPAGSSEKEAEERLNLYLAGKSLDIKAAVFRDGNGRMHIEMDGEGTAALKKTADWLDRISAVLSRPLCEMESESGRRHIVLLEAEPLAVRIGVASMRRSGEEVSGDKGAYFKTDSGLLYVILSDGMGSGEGAAQDSDEVIALLEKFLRAGISAECAMRLVGAAMQIKNERKLASASVDLLSVNLFTGEADIFKYGAAPTFVKSSSGVSVHKGESLSAGLRGDRENLPDHIKSRLEPGSTALIVSDGVTGGEDAAWLSSELREEKTPGREFARRVLEEAGRRYGCADDMTVISVSVEKR